MDTEEVQDKRRPTFRGLTVGEARITQKMVSDAIRINLINSSIM